MYLATHARESQVSSLRFFRLTGVSRRRHKDENFFFSFSNFRNDQFRTRVLKNIASECLWNAGKSTALGYKNVRSLAISHGETSLFKTLTLTQKLIICIFLSAFCMLQTYLLCNECQ